jgi:hypothetical protein
MTFRTIRVPEETYNRVKEALETVIHQGWQGFGSKRQSNISLGSVVDEAITQFQARAKKKR